MGGRRMWFYLYLRALDLFQLYLHNLYTDGLLELDNQSCEMMASALLSIVKEQYPGRSVDVEVSEDGECGSIVSYLYENV